MSTIHTIPIQLPAVEERPETLWLRAMRSGRVVVGGAILLIILVACLGSLPWTLDRPEGGQTNLLYYDQQNSALHQREPTGELLAYWFGTDVLGRSLLARSLLGGAISLTIGLAAAAISVVLGVGVGLVAGYRGGWIDSALMRFVDVLYGLPYILMVILIKIALERPLGIWLGDASAFFAVTFGPDWAFNANLAASVVVLFLAIGLVSWLTMARVIRGQVLSLRSQPFIEAAKASGLGEGRIFLRHLLPNLVGPIIVYATLTVPVAILQESFLSFLGIGIQQPLPTWGSLASEGLLPALNPVDRDWWLLVVPCALLGVTLLSLNFLGDGLRDIFDPRRGEAKI